MIAEFVLLVLMHCGVPFGADGAVRLDLPCVGFEIVTVTPDRVPAPLVTTPAPVTVLGAEALAAAPQRALDDVLRATPGFTLFRAASSRVANPTAQGVTLRGLGGSGASRALVLLDGVPVNDPFGGWVAWSRLPVLIADRVEVGRGGASELYGAGALSGVVQVVSVEPAAPTLRVLTEAGSGPLFRVSSLAGGRRGTASVLVAADLQRDEGAYVVAEENRGAVDEAAGADHGTVFARLDVAPGPRVRGALRASIFDEDRRNGTPLQVNDTDMRQVTASLSGTATRGWWQARGTWSGQTYDQHFSSVSSDRSTEALTRTQRVPAELAGASVEWNGAFHGATYLLGADAARVDGTTRETPYVAGRPGTTSEAGGRQDSLGGFAHVRARARTFTVSGGARAERWQVRDEANGRTRANRAFVPRATLAWAGAPWHAAIGVSAAFRAPTLNELFRGFRVGDTVTRANPDLLPERARGADFTLLRSSSRGSIRTTAFWTVLDDPIANVTVAASPTLIVRERRNAGRLRSAGAEAEGEWRIATGLRTRGSFVATDAVFAEGPEPGLEGNRVPQVPRYQAGATLHATPRRGLDVALDLRWFGERFEDDRNTLPLGDYATLDVMVSQAAGPECSLPPRTS